MIIEVATLSCFSTVNFCFLASRMASVTTESRRISIRRGGSSCTFFDRKKTSSSSMVLCIQFVNVISCMEENYLDSLGCIGSQCPVAVDLLSSMTLCSISSSSSWSSHVPCINIELNYKYHIDTQLNTKLTAGRVSNEELLAASTSNISESQSLLIEVKKIIL